MIKSVFKEIVIVLLLIIIIILLLGILFYDYMPINKTVPSKVQEYVLEDVIKQELDKGLNDVKSEEIIKTYQLDSYDIENYEKTNEYNKGKVNPFAVYNSGTSNNTTDGNTSSNGNTNTNTNNNTNTDKQDPTKDNFLGTSGK